MRSIALAFSAVLAATVSATAAYSCNLPSNAAALREEAVQLINAQRKAAGLSSVRPSNALSRAAQGHACDSAMRRKMSHVGSDGSKFTTRILRAGYSYAGGSPNENVGWGYNTPSGIVQGWMESSGHRKNILSGKVREIGIGVAADANNHLYWVMVAAKPGR